MSIVLALRLISSLWQEWRILSRGDHTLSSHGKHILTIAAAGEVITGAILLVYPPIVVRLLLGADVVGAGIAVARIAGMGLLAIGLACWPGRDATGRGAALLGMLTYSVLVALYLIRVGVVYGGGVLLWPAVAAHGVVALLLARAWLRR
ncbi:MAG TPA: hypothetical protein VMI34_22035 [Candidatus Bathyarchaeia archaeon]|nr:hypothetical protein [Candidatus Bathyarchaeia archaeon]